MAPPFDPLAPCCHPTIQDGCGDNPNGESCPKSDRGETQYCMTLNTHVGGLRCRCADATTAKALRKLGWEYKNGQVARVDRPREIAAFIPSPSPDNQSLIGLLDLYAYEQTPSRNLYLSSVPSPIPSIPLTPRDKVTACNQRCRDLVYQDFAHQTETQREFKDRVNKCEFNCLQYFDV